MSEVIKCARTVHDNSEFGAPYKCQKTATHLAEKTPMCTKHFNHWYQKMEGKKRRGEIESFNCIPLNQHVKLTPELDKKDR